MCKFCDSGKKELMYFDNRDSMRTSFGQYMGVSVDAYMYLVRKYFEEIWKKLKDAAIVIIAGRQTLLIGKNIVVPNMDGWYY